MVGRWPLKRPCPTLRLLLVISAVSTRREKIEAMLKAEPEDQFLRYSLACEFDNEDRSDESLALFHGLIADRPPNVHAFFRGAQLLVKLDRIAEARTMLRDGIEAARQQNEMHAAGEMGELLMSLGKAGE
jgi:predicted Zn-dependent protease